jgi:hypothetical protein
MMLVDFDVDSACTPQLDHQQNHPYQQRAGAVLIDSPSPKRPETPEFARKLKAEAGASYANWKARQADRDPSQSLRTLQMTARLASARSPAAVLPKRKAVGAIAHVL